MKNYSLPLLFIFSIFSSCLAQESTWNLSPDLQDGWTYNYPIKVGMNEDSLGNLLNLIQSTPPRDFRALVVIKDGQLIVDEYFNSFGNTNINDIRSAGKSVTSMLAGIAIKQKLFKPSDKVISFFPEYKNIKNPSPEKSNITIEDLLVMSSGLAADAYVEDSPGREQLMVQAEDYVKFVLDLSMDSKPGERYAYSSAVAFLLGAIVENTSKMTLEDFARKHLFGPLQIKGFYWQKSPKGRNTGMGNLYLQARDFAKLGQVMLDGGKWKGQEILSKDFVTRSIEKRFDISEEDPFAHGYGYMWYLGNEKIGDQTIEFFFASGNGGNKTFVVPSLNMVVTTLSSAYGPGVGHNRSHIIFRKILESIILRD